MSLRKTVSFYVIASAALLLGLTLMLGQCTNSPHRAGAAETNTVFLPYGGGLKTLDPARAYFTNEVHLLMKVTEAPFSYHFLKRPYELMPLVVEDIPASVSFDENGAVLPADAPNDQVARVEYTFRVKKGVPFQPHPCFAKDAQGKPLYGALTEEDMRGIESPDDFEVRETRELLAADFDLALRRIADPKLASPIRSTFGRFIVGMDDLYTSYSAMREAIPESKGGVEPLLDYMKPEFSGLEVIDDHTFKLIIKRRYPQAIYWMAMPFFAPIPMEYLEFLNQKPLIDRQIDMDHWPLGTNAHRMTTHKTDQKIVLKRHPDFRETYYPTEGEPGDAEAGLLDDAGKRLPFVDGCVMLMEKEQIPSWNKFRQGYYDASSIATDVFDQAVEFSQEDGAGLSPEMEEQGVQMLTNVATVVYGLHFNMIDDVVGGYTEERAKLRQAITIALDMNEYLAIFYNSRGIASQGPLPPGIFGYRGGEAETNPYTDVWNPQLERHETKSLDEARRLLAEAGYPEGRDENGRPLTITFSHGSAGNSAFDSTLKWYRSRVEELGIQLKDEGMHPNALFEKKKKGEWQVSSGGWGADYPDPENFYFLFYGPNCKVPHGGENGCNYSNPTYDALFEQMESMENSPERQRIIDELTEILRHDAPWAWGYHPVQYGLYQSWYRNNKGGANANDLKYKRLVIEDRVEGQREWNEPRTWPIMVLAALLLLAGLPAVVIVHRRERGR